MEGQEGIKGDLGGWILGDRCECRCGKFSRERLWGRWSLAARAIASNVAARVRQTQQLKIQ
ncbi:MAG: hypothetical protein DI617_09065 [Streptococcus pyogenes]|nr:MAG: hypothetical protein DI617_09065 [Streptococcus pyogenes]